MLFNIFKYIFFSIHLFFILVSITGWPFCYYLIYLQLIAIISWLLNGNKCIISQIEYKLFNSTIVDNGSTTVPFRHRFVLYISFLFSSIYYYKLQNL